MKCKCVRDDQKIPICQVACACAVAAFKLRRPVKMYLDRKTDMIIAGGRHPIKAKYSVGFKSDGKITAIHLDLALNAGIALDLSALLPPPIIGGFKKYNWGALAFDIKVCKTNVSSKFTMRAPGHVQGSFIAEAIIEHVASTLSVDTNTIGGGTFMTSTALQCSMEKVQVTLLPTAWSPCSIS